MLGDIDTATDGDFPNVDLKSKSTLKSDYTSSDGKTYQIQSLVTPRPSRQARFHEEIDRLRKNYPSYTAKHRTIYRNKSISVNRLPAKDFTEVIKLPVGRFHTKDEVLKAKGYRLKKKIGRGGYGVVWKAQFRDAKEDCAVKIINLRNRTSYDRMLAHLKTEIYIMERFTHPNVITLLDHFIIDDNAFIVMEFATDGSLADFVEKRGPLAERLAFEMFIQILRGLVHLHVHRIAHRDLKLDNILLRKPKFSNRRRTNETLVAKLTDFGLSSAAYRPREGYIKTGNFAGTRGYMSPEIIRLEVFEDLDTENSLDFDPFRADIWALGVVLYEMVTATLPFQAYESDLPTMFKMQMEQRWTVPKSIEVSNPLRDLLRKLMEPSPVKRLDPVSIWFHPWLQTTPLEEEKKLKGLNSFCDSLWRFFRRER